MIKTKNWQKKKKKKITDLNISSESEHTSFSDDSSSHSSKVYDNMTVSQLEK